MSKRTNASYSTSLDDQLDKRPRLAPLTQAPPAQLSSSISKESFLIVLGYLNYHDVIKVKEISPYMSKTINEARPGFFNFSTTHTQTLFVVGNFPEELLIPTFHQQIVIPSTPPSLTCRPKTMRNSSSSTSTF